MKPVESIFVSLVSMGEGWHNYHHAFPWDYRAAELGFRYSPTTFIIDILARLGLAYDLRTTSPQMVEHRIKRTGDGSHPIHDDLDRFKEGQKKPQPTTDDNGNQTTILSDEDLKGSVLIKRPFAVQG